MSVDQPFNIYRERLSSHYHGLALWDPKPVESLHKKPSHVSIGDVGYLDDGAFMRMFNVTLPWDDPSNKLIGKPEKYERIKLIGNVRDYELHEGEYYTPLVYKVNNIDANTYEESRGQMYQCSARDRGALLYLPHSGNRKDVILLQVFKNYIRDNVDKWFRWSKKMMLPVEHMEDLILVTGCTLVSSWAAAAFDGHMSADSNAPAISLEAREADGGGTKYFWRNKRGNVEYHNCGVKEPQSQNQCVFIKGFRAKRTFFRTIPMRAAAEPLPDDPDNRREDEIQVTRIPDSLKYRDPLVGILDYIIEKSNEGIMAIAHDDDLRLIEGVELLSADAIEEFLHQKQMPLLVENGAAILKDAASNNELPVSDEKNLKATFLHSFSNRNSAAILPETNQMTTERKKDRFLDLFRRTSKARSPSLHGIKNPPSSNVYPVSSEASSYNSRMLARKTVQRDYEIPIVSPKHNAVVPQRVRSQDFTSSQPRRDDKNYPPSSFGFKPRQRSRSYSFQPLERGQLELESWDPFQRYGSVPRAMTMDMDMTPPQGARSFSRRPDGFLLDYGSRSPQEPGPLSKTSSGFSIGRVHGPQPTGTQLESESKLVSMTGQIPADKQEHQPRFPSELQSLLPNDFRFRILVVGKPRSGKSSLINTIFNVDLSRAPMEASGSIVEFRPLDNRRLIVHECSAFGPGELQVIRDYIASRPASERLHAIWICVPMTDVVNREFDEGLKLLLGPEVPVVIVFTMFDLIIPNDPSHGNGYERAMATAYTKWEGHCRTLFGNVRAEIVSTQPRFHDPILIAKLVATTDEAIIAHSRNISGLSKAQLTQPRLSAVTLAWSVSQRASHGIKIHAAIEVGQNRYWRRLGSSEEFAGQTLANCVELIHSDIIEVWNFLDKDRYLSSTSFKARISHLLQDLSRPPIGILSRYKLSAQGTGPPWLSERYENRNEYHICLLMAYIVDLTLVLCDIFGLRRDVSPSDAHLVVDNFSNSSPKNNIHTEICSFLKTVYQFQYEYQDNDVVLEKIINLINYDSPYWHDP